MEVLCYFGTGVGTAIIVTTATTVADNVVTVADQPIPDNSITVVAVITVVVTTVVVVTTIVVAQTLVKHVVALADSFKKILAELKQEFFDIDKRQNLCYNFAKRSAK